MLKPLKSFYARKPEIFILFLFPVVLFLFSLFLRMVFFSGFIFADDAEEFGLLEFLNSNGPNYKGYLQYRFSLWIFNLFFFKLFGISELTFFLPTWLMSSSLCVIGFFILLKLRYSPGEAFWAGMFIASVPFEVLIGSIRANDLILSWFMALSLLFFFLLDRRPVAQGILMALCLWFAFYDKIWTVYFFPAIGIYYLTLLLKYKEWKGALSFAGGTLFFHSISSLFWLKKMGVLMPYLSIHPPTFPVAVGDLFDLWKRYPGFLFQGSEFGTTLFGWVPYLLIALILTKIGFWFFDKKGKGNPRLDRTDGLLMVYYLSFFLLLEFFPNSFQFDQYYSSPRIFRYLTPLSFPMTLHLAKLSLDFYRYSKVVNFSRNTAALAVLMIGILSLNIIQVSAATEPGRVYRSALTSIVKDIRSLAGGTVYVESWLGFFMRQVYFRNDRDRYQFKVNLRTYKATDYEKWLGEIQPALEKGNLLITGLGSNVHYGGHYDGFRLEQFESPLDPGWKLIGEYATLGFLPNPEKARLWAWKGVLEEDPEKTPEERSVDASGGPSPEELFKAGMKEFDAGFCSQGHDPFTRVIDEFPENHLADDAFYFRTICYFSNGKFLTTIEEFDDLLKRYPKSTWAAGAHYHIGVSYRNLNKFDAARREFRLILKEFSHDKTLVDLSNKQLGEMENG